jgi:hypothetical protein
LGTFVLGEGLMTKNLSIKSLIFFNVLTLWLVNTILAMESPKNKDLPMQMVSLSIAGTHHTTEVNEQDFIQEIQIRGNTCRNEIERGNNAQTNEKKAFHYERAREWSGNLFDCCKFYVQRDGYQHSDNGLGIYTLLDISTRLGRGWTQKIDLKSLTPSLATQFYNTLLSLIAIDMFVYERPFDLFLFSNSNHSPKNDPDAAHYRLLSHLGTLFTHFYDRIEIDQKDKYLSDAYDCFDHMTCEKWKKEAKKQLDIISGKLKQGPATKAADITVEALDKGTRERDFTYTPTRPYNPTSDFLKAINLKDEFFSILKSTKDKIIYGDPEWKAHQAILEIEAKISQKLGIIRQPGKRTLEDYTKIYKELGSFCTPERVREHLPEFIIILQNYGDHEGGEFRRKAITDIVYVREKARENRRQQLGIKDTSSDKQSKQQTLEAQSFQLSPLSSAPQQFQPSQIFWKSTYLIPPRPFDLSCKDNFKVGSAMMTPTSMVQKELKPTNVEEKKQTGTEQTSSTLTDVQKHTGG